MLDNIPDSGTIRDYGTNITEVSRFWFCGNINRMLYLIENLMFSNEVYACAQK
ncbi:hypothetical protein NSMM_370117 [Nitrosomonas mobilis]|uniref:Uncharacterized protein n=1 Tax=Nitrosomonas mobilis TaxID=51642 RepID=A0A1G5SE00_9PROT|nr:hypothetical protein NSMM_370117 [Nitrosomonas mobilis]